MLEQIPGTKPVTVGGDKGYDTADFVRAADREPRAFEEIERLLQQGERPLGYIARLSEGRGQPFVQP